MLRMEFIKSLFVGLLALVGIKLPTITKKKDMLTDFVVGAKDALMMIPPYGSLFMGIPNSHIHTFQRNGLDMFEAVVDNWYTSQPEHPPTGRVLWCLYPFNKTFIERASSQPIANPVHWMELPVADNPGWEEKCRLEVSIGFDKWVAGGFQFPTKTA